MKKFIYFFIALEIMAILFLSVNFFRKKVTKNVLGAVSVVPKEKTHFIFPETSEAKHFFEFTPRVIWIEDAAWMPRGRGGRYTINSDGLNARQEYSVVKPPGTFRIIALGDSFTNGDYVDTPYNYPSQLEDLLNNSLKCPGIKKFEVLNFGVGGYDIHYSVLRYKLRGVKYNPDLVLWYMFPSDFFSVNELRVARAEELGKEMLEKGIKDLTYANGEFYPNWMQAEREMWEKYTEDELISREYKYLTDFGKLYSGRSVIFTDRFTEVKYKELMKLFLSTKSGGYFFDGIEDYPRLPDDHPTKEAYTYIVKTISDYLVDAQIIPCEKK